MPTAGRIRWRSLRPCQFDAVFSALKDRDNIVYIDADGTKEQVHERIVSAVNNAFRED